MIPLLKMYDNFASNKGISLGITAASTACTIYGFIGYVARQPQVFFIGASTGVAFAILANTYLAYNDKVERKDSRNSIYATLSLINAFAGLESNKVIYSIFKNTITKLLNYFYAINFDYWRFADSFKIGFSVGIFALQVLESERKFKFQSPFVFS